MRTFWVLESRVDLLGSTQLNRTMPRMCVQVAVLLFDLGIRRFKALSLFRGDVRPEWEHAANRDGFKGVVKLSAYGVARQAWTTLCALCVARMIATPPQELLRAPSAWRTSRAGAPRHESPLIGASRRHRAACPWRCAAARQPADGGARAVLQPPSGKMTCMRT